MHSLLVGRQGISASACEGELSQILDGRPTPTPRAFGGFLSGQAIEDKALLVHNTSDLSESSLPGAGHKGHIALLERLWRVSGWCVGGGA
ncbi:hypothetical protein ASF76_08050 [Microbacterium sp. Leaf151]|nr:hypothetical protein ASF76_08050 [Microbacterium sp. Leaf151]